MSEQCVQRPVNRFVNEQRGVANASMFETFVKRGTRRGKMRKKAFPHGSAVAYQFVAGFLVAEPETAVERKVALLGGEHLNRQNFAARFGQTFDHRDAAIIETIADKYNQIMRADPVP